MTPRIAVHAINVMDEGEWSFRAAGPVWRPPGRYVGQTPFDPFPAYAHDLNMVNTTARYLSEVVIAPCWNIDLYIADREETTRSNGHSNVYEDHGDPPCDPTALIVLSGKRVPPHPAVTRYLVAHEYGHHIEWMINAARGERNLHDEALAAEYARLRGLPASALHHGDGGRWHDSIHEIFACDFRLLIAAIEPEHWPHPGIPHPCEDRDLEGRLRTWWRDQLALIDQTNAPGGTSA